MEMDQDYENRPQPISIWLGSLASSRTSGNDETPGKDEAILALLAKLALHYWRPDFTPGQARQVYADYVYDLGPFALSDIASAINKYRQTGANRFFPTSGALIDIITQPCSWESEPNAPDRARTLARTRREATERGTAEAKAMRLRLSGGAELGALTDQR